MSFDFALLKLCSHYIVDEVATLDPSTSLYFAPAKTLASLDNLIVSIDGYDIPETGLYSRAVVPCSRPAPYRISPNTNDLLIVKIQNDLKPVELVLTPGKDLSAGSLALDVSTKLGKFDSNLNRPIRLGARASSNNHLVIESVTPVKGKYFQIIDPRVYFNDPSVSLPQTLRCLNTMDTLGLIPGRVGSGHKIYPGWEVTLNPNYPIPQHIIKFNSPIVNYSPVVRVSYSTLSNTCARCIGTKMEYDYTVSGNSYEVVTNTDLLAQEADKFLFTEIGSHWKWRWLGSSLSKRIGSKSNALGSTASALVNIDLSSAFNTYQNIKRQQSSNFPYQNVSDAEYPASLVSATSQNSPNDPTVVLANITISSASRAYVPVTRVVTPPDPFSITTDPGGLMQQASNGFTQRV